MNPSLARGSSRQGDLRMTWEGFRIVQVVGQRRRPLENLEVWAEYCRFFRSFFFAKQLGGIQRSAFTSYNDFKYAIGGHSGEIVRDIWIGWSKSSINCLAQHQTIIECQQRSENVLVTFDTVVHGSISN
ncbi:hypothetical protein ABKN59_009767 [Abortiporus biennis]